MATWFTFGAWVMIFFGTDDIGRKGGAMSEEIPEVMQREWLEVWLAEHYPYLALHEVGVTRGFYDKAVGPESFQGFSTTWRSVFDYLNREENRVE